MWLSSSASKRELSSSRSPSASTAASPGSTLGEALRKHPFRSGVKEAPAKEEKDDGTTSLNKDLHILANLFPDVQIDVLRELLTRFDGESRLTICTAQLLKYKPEWARGRMQVPPRELDEAIPVEEQFRRRDYSAAAFKVLALEFRSSSKSVINAVLAEVNHSYTKARPVLRDLANNSRWNLITSVFGYKKKKAGDEPPAVLFERGKFDPQSPKLLSTGVEELDRELHALFILPVERRSLLDQEASDLTLAHTLNHAEADEAEAMYECQVCYNDVTFEELSTCSSEGHVICLDCVRRTLHEGIFGQGWAKSIDTHSGTLKCLAPTTNEECRGHISQALLKHAVLNQKSGREIWAKFEERLADEAVHQSAMALIRCPFCSYAEADQVYNSESSRPVRWRIRKPTAVNKLAFILILELLPALLFLLLPIFVLFPRLVKTVFYTSLGHLALRHRTTRFSCLNPRCRRKSCLKCSKAWHDPHICHEPLILSLRTTVEAARTAAIKRTCPRCGTSFVKASGCNKLTCVCGYAMCYLCRTNIGKTGENEGAEGYRHFCEHFRPNPGKPCAECDKCDLYKAEDEDGVVKRAGEAAERAWREREGMVGVQGLEDATGNVAGEDTLWNRFVQGRWTMQGAVDALVEMVVVVDPT